MHPLRRRRLLGITAIFCCLFAAVVLTLFALRENINLFYTPTQIAAGEVKTQQRIRIGGLVQEGSIQRSTSDLVINFTVTDNNQTISVRYEGILPDLFREGQGVVANGRLTMDGYFVADQILAKHDENYMPAEVAWALAEGEAA